MNDVRPGLEGVWKIALYFEESTPLRGCLLQGRGHVSELPHLHYRARNDLAGPHRPPFRILSFHEEFDLGFLLVTKREM